MREPTYRRLAGAAAQTGAAALLGCAATGCLSTSYTVDRRELERLSQTPENARADLLHVKQRTFLGDDADAIAEGRLLVETAQGGKVVRVATLEVAKELAIVREGLAEIRGLTGEAAGSAKPAAQTAKTQPSRAHPEASASHAEAPAAGPTADDDKKKRDAKGDDVGKALIVGAVILGGVFIGTGLAVSEGQRFDGYVSTEPSLPLHLRGPDGEIGWVSLRALTPAMLGGVREGIVSGEDGRLVRTRRAPLDRAGFAFGAELGMVGMNTLERDFSPGFMGRFTIGYYPVQQLGLLAGAALAVGPKGPVSVGSEITPLVEIDVLPIAFSGNNLGLYAEGGRVIGVERVPSLQLQTVGSWTYGGGLLYQRELTTLLALFVRGGVKVFPGPGTAAVAPQLSLGVAIY